MTELSVEQKIEKFYKAENGVWLVEKGKVTEAKLLKEAFERINSLKADRKFYYDLYMDAAKIAAEPYKKERDYWMKKYEEQQKLNKRMTEFYNDMKNVVLELELLKKEVDDV
jgi:hypothetical protein